MPYSAEKTKQKIAQKIAQRAKENFINTAMEAKHQAFKDLYKEMYQIFDMCIDQYYRYETKSYYRHETGIGSCTGINLYRANQIKHIQIGYSDNLIVGWSGEDMASYRNGVDADYVMDNVAKGIRGLADEYLPNGFTPRKSEKYENHWSAKVSTKYFGELEGTPDKIVDEIEKMWDEVSGNVFIKHFMSIYKG